VTDIRRQLQQAASDEGVPLRTDAHQLLGRARARRRRHRTRTAAFAVVPTVAVLAAGGVLGTSLLPADSGRDGDSNDAPAVGTSHLTSQGPTSDPGLPPTAENLYQVLVTSDGWTFDGMENSKEWGGSQYWKNGGQWLEVQWYPAAQYDTYLRDRRHGTTERAVELLGQSGLEFTEKPEPDSPPTQADPPLDRPEPGGMVLGGGWTGNGGGLVDGHRVYTILPAVGDYFLMVDAYTTDRAAFDDVIGSLTRVDEATWERAVDRGIVTEAEGEAFLAEAKRDVPMPGPVDVTIDDLDLPQSPYHARAAFVGPVLCGWAERYVAGDAQALETLRDSRDWPVLQAMRPEGDYAQVVAQEIEQLASGTTDKGNPYTLELFGQAVGC
jgi:hypothetical protein